MISDVLKNAYESLCDETRALGTEIVETFGKLAVEWKKAAQDAARYEDDYKKNQQELARQQAERNALASFNRIMCRAITAIPDFVNLDTRVAAYSLRSRWAGGNLVQFAIFKKRPGEPFSDGAFENSRDALNAALSGLLFEAEKAVSARRVRANDALNQLSVDCQRFPGQRNYEKEYYDIINNYQNFLNNNYYYLFGFNVIDFEDRPEAVIFTVVCDPTVRIQL